MGAGRGQRGDVAAEQPGFAILEQHVAVGQVRLAGPQALYFPTGQDQPGLELVFDEVIVSRFLVLRDGPGRMFLLFSHRGGIIGNSMRGRLWDFGVLEPPQ